MRAYLASLDAALRVNTRRASRRGRLPLLVACVILTWIANVGHLTLVPHAVCSDHGELVHAGDAHGEEHAAAQETRTSHPAIERDGGDHSHDHCWAAAGELALSLTARCLLASLLIWSLVSWRPVQRACIYARRFLLAPKTSPPLVA